PGHAAGFLHRLPGAFDAGRNERLPQVEHVGRQRGAEPAPPAAWFAAYYAFLENDLGFQSTWVRTDYQFASLDEAVELLSFFWDDEFGETARRNNWIITPECTGIWWKEVQ
ncbi:MAG: hypothetical protein HGB05_22620, partial [Chloroflexi bacterium]|nr:hypothetical protein [Chloroflexota bacterium]